MRASLHAVIITSKVVQFAVVPRNSIWSLFAAELQQRKAVFGWQLEAEFQQRLECVPPAALCGLGLFRHSERWSLAS